MEPGHPGARDVWCLAEVDIFADLSEPEMERIAAAAPMKSYAAGDLIFSPHRPTEALFILKRGRVRIFRVSPDGRALTTAIVTPGTIFGEMLPLGQRMHDNFAEALDDSVVCVMGRADVQRFLLSDPRIAPGSRRTSASAWPSCSGACPTPCSRRFRSASPQPCVCSPVTSRDRVCAAGCRCRSPTRSWQRSREHLGRPATKVLDEYAHRGLVRLARGRITILDPDRVAAEAGE